MNDHKTRDVLMRVAEAVRDAYAGYWVVIDSNGAEPDLAAIVDAALPGQPFDFNGSLGVAYDDSVELAEHTAWTQKDGSISPWDAWKARADIASTQPEPVNQQMLAALKAMAAEFRAHDLPYGSKAYASAITAINTAQAQQPQAVGVPDGRQPIVSGLYAVLHRDNWDGEGDTHILLARLKDDGTWIADESGKPLVQYEGDAILRFWPLADDTAQAQQPQAVVVPDGWQLVPKEPTPRMLVALGALQTGYLDDNCHPYNGALGVDTARILYRGIVDMLAAAPKPEGQQ